MGKRGKPRTTVEERFWRNVDKRGPDECWNWTASKSGGYGRVLIGMKPPIRTGAHRISYLIHNGILRSDLDVLHTCDNPSCVNPNHLKLGTTAENMHDREIKGRAKNKLKRWQVEEIKTLLAAGYSQAVIAPRYNVTQGAISHINVGITWGWVKPSLGKLPLKQLPLPFADGY